MPEQSPFIGSGRPVPLALLAHLAAGTGVGTAQWLLLRHQAPDAWWWVVTSAASWTVTFVVLKAPPDNYPDYIRHPILAWFQLVALFTPGPLLAALAIGRLLGCATR